MSALDIKDQAKEDVWLRQLNWNTTPPRYMKARFKKDGTYAKNGQPRLISRQFLPGFPEWYKEAYNRELKDLKITTRARIAPLILKLKWFGWPLYYSKVHGWTYRVPLDCAESKRPLEFDPDPTLDTFEPIPVSEIGKFVYFRIPHPKDDTSKCGNPLAKNYIPASENGTLTSEFSLAKEALQMNAMCSYWISARERVNAQFIVWNGDANVLVHQQCQNENDKIGIILPVIQTMGTVTRRAVEPTWLTASNAKRNRIGSELKAMVKAPKG